MKNYLRKRISRLGLVAFTYIGYYFISEEPGNWYVLWNWLPNMIFVWLLLEGFVYAIEHTKLNQ